MKDHKRLYKQLHANKLDKLKEMDKFLETYNLSRLNKEDIENLNKPKLSLQGTHHRILDSLPALVRKREILPLTPESVTLGVGKTPAFRSTKPYETWHPSHEECPFVPSKGL